MWADRIASPQTEDIETLSSKSKDGVKKTGFKPQLSKKNQIQPANFSSPGTKSVSSPKLQSWIDFGDTFGPFGPVLVTIVLISIAWTTWLIVLTIEPNATANYLMDTSEFDNGQFWLIVDPDFSLKVLGVLGLVLVDACYLFMLLKMVSCRHPSPDKEKEEWNQLVAVQVLYERVKNIWGNITGIRGKYRKFWNLAQKIGDLTMQSIVLGQLLQDGPPTILVIGYAVFLCANAFSVATGIMLGNQSALNEILVDSIFDMIAAVLFPIIVLVYSANSFDFGRELFNINIEVLPPGSFECNARLFSDPAERALFITSLNSLRILSFNDLALRVSMNFSFCLRFFSVINLMLETAQTQKSRQSAWVALAQMFEQQRRVPKLFAVFFVAFGIAVVAYTQKSIATSQTVCGPYPECVVYAYQWGDSEFCPCRTFVDVYLAPRTFEEWSEPVDVSETVKALSQAGMLQNLQIINRGLSQWPAELRSCANLQYLSLIYTETETIPEWAKEWTNLQFIHIEGKQLRPSLVNLPEDLFSNMPYLQMIHLGVHPKLLCVPPLLGVPNLRSLTLAALYSVREIPSFENVPKLQHLELPYMQGLQTIPDMAALQNLVDFTIFSVTPVCCNGFMDQCDPADWFCEGFPLTNVPPSVCLDENSPRPTAATQKLFQKFASSLCIRSGFDIAKTVDFITPSMIEVCGGVPYRRCEYPPRSGHFGICMNNRLQALMCMVNDDYIRLRQVQIQRKVGPPCNVDEEAWLGCGT